VQLTSKFDKVMFPFSAGGGSVVLHDEISKRKKEKE
jgi:hypothetical protein